MTQNHAWRVRRFCILFDGIQSGMKIHQIVSGYRRFDAISDAANLLQGIFSSWGCESAIYCMSRSVAPECRKAVRDLGALSQEMRPNDIAVLHLSIGNESNCAFAALGCRKVVIYHNITPPDYFTLVAPSTAAALGKGRLEAAKLADVAEINLADSAYNAAELLELGFRAPKVFPLPIDLSRFAPKSFKKRDIPFDHSGNDFNILFVGRFAPNKKIEDIVKTMFFLERIEPRARFFHIGAFTGVEAYNSIVTAYAERLGLRRYDFLGSVSQATLNAAYANADAFLCMSEHEGFCAPLVEAMLHRVPVFAMANSAVPETLDGAGVLFKAPPDCPLIAETIAEVLHDPALRASIVARQERRLETIRSRDISAELRRLLAPVLSPR